MPLLTGVVRVEDSSGNRIDAPKADGTHSPIVLKLDSTLRGTAVQNGGTVTVTLSAPGTGGGGVVSYQDHDAFRAIDPENLSDGQVINFINPPGQYVYVAAEGAGFADDDNNIIRPDDISLGSPGRAVNVSSQIVPTVGALRLVAGLGLFRRYEVQAFSTLGDNGGGTFHDVTGVVSHADNTGVFVVAGSRLLKRDYDGTIEVKWFGAIGDNVSIDNGPAIQAAIDYAHELVVTARSGMQTARFKAVKVHMHGARFFVGFLTGLLSAVSHTFQHAIELPDNVSLEGETNTVILPHQSIWTTFTANAGSDFVTSTISVANGARVRVSLGNGATMPGNVFGGVDYYVGNFSAGTFKLYTDVGLTSLVNISSNGSGTLWIFKPIALVRIWGYDNVVNEISFCQGSHAIALCGIVRDVFGSYWNPGIGPEHLNAFNNCQFNEQASVAVWLDHTPVSVPGPTGSSPFQPGIVFSHCRGFGPSFIWGTFDKAIVNDLIWGWDQQHFVPDTSGDGFPLGLFNTNSNLLVTNALIECYTPLTRGCMFIAAGGSIVVTGLTQFDNGSCFVRTRFGSATEYKGPIGEAVFDLSLGGGKPYVNVSDTLINAVGIPWCEVYDVFPAILDVHLLPLNQNSSTGVYVNDSVSLITTQQKHLVDQQIKLHGLTSNFGRFRYGDETARTGASTDITNLLRPYFLYSPSAIQATTHEQKNLFQAGAIDVADILRSSTNTSISGTNTTEDGYVLTNYVATPADATFSFESSDTDYFNDLAAGLYRFSFEVLASFAGEIAIKRTYNGVQANQAPVRFVGGMAAQKISGTIYLPTLTGGDTFTLGAVLTTNAPNGSSWSIGKFQLTRGEGDVPYTRPTDNHTSPTVQLTKTSPTTYYVDTFQTALGTYNSGDVQIKRNPAGGEVWGMRCTTGGTGTAMLWEEMGRLTNVADPLSVTSQLSTFVDIDNSGATVTAGESVTFSKTLAGVDRGDEITVSALQDPGDGWSIFASITTTNQVRVTVANLTGADAAIPKDPFGVRVIVKKHPLFWKAFPSPYAWLIADLGVGLGSGHVSTWTDQFGLGHGASQGTDAKRPTVNSADVGGRDTFSGTNAADTNLTVAWPVTAQSTIVLVANASAVSPSYYLSEASGAGMAITYVTGDRFKWFNAGEAVDMLVVGGSALHVFVIVHDDAGNLRIFADGTKVHDAAIGHVSAGQNITKLFNIGTLGGAVSAKLPLSAIFHAAFTDDQAVELSREIKAYYNL